jgi:hypothetical protein
MAFGGRYGFAQSLFQLDRSCGSATGPLLAAFIVLPRGQSSVAWFSLLALLAMVMLTYAVLSATGPSDCWSWGVMATISGVEGVKRDALPEMPIDSG